MNPVGTRSTASELLMREIPDAVERVPTQWFMGSRREILFRGNLSLSDGERDGVRGFISFRKLLRQSGQVEAR